MRKEITLLRSSNSHLNDGPVCHTDTAVTIFIFAVWIEIYIYIKSIKYSWEENFIVEYNKFITSSIKRGDGLPLNFKTNHNATKFAKNISAHKYRGEGRAQHRVCQRYGSI